MNKHFGTLNKREGIIRFTENGVVQDSVVVLFVDALCGFIFPTQNGKRYRLTKNDARRLQMENIMQQMREENYVPENDTFLI